jgi:hypothetical protein
MRASVLDIVIVTLSTDLTDSLAIISTKPFVTLVILQFFIHLIFVTFFAFYFFCLTNI